MIGPLVSYFRHALVVLAVCTFGGHLSMRYWDAFDGEPHVTTARHGARPNWASGAVAEGRFNWTPEARFGRARSPHLIAIATRTAASP